MLTTPETAGVRSYTVRDLARILRLTEDTIRRKARRREIPGAFRTGNRWRFRMSTVDRWLDRGGER